MKSELFKQINHKGKILQGRSLLKLARAQAEPTIKKSPI